MEVKRQAAARFFVGIARQRKASEKRCQWTEPLFPLWLILDADGTLARDCSGLVGREVRGGK